MLCAVEAGASLAEATDEALAWGARHTDNDLLEQRLQAAWEAARHDKDEDAVGTAAESVAAQWS
jgi:hypothetical protein